MNFVWKIKYFEIDVVNNKLKFENDHKEKELETKHHEKYILDYFERVKLTLSDFLFFLLKKKSSFLSSVEKTSNYFVWLTLITEILFG